MENEILNKKTKSVITKLIKEKFFSITKDEIWRYAEQCELLETAKNMGLTHLEEELTEYISQ